MMKSEKKILAITVFPDQGDRQPIGIWMTKAQLKAQIAELQSLLVKEFGDTSLYT